MASDGDACLCCGQELLAVEKLRQCDKCGNSICARCAREVRRDAAATLSSTAAASSSERSLDGEGTQPASPQSCDTSVTVCKDCEFMGKWVTDVKAKDKGRFWNIKMPRFLRGGRKEGESGSSSKKAALDQKFALASSLAAGTGAGAAPQRAMAIDMDAIQQDLHALSREKLKELHDQKKLILELQQENARMRGEGGGANVKAMIDELKKESEAHIVQLEQQVQLLLEQNQRLKQVNALQTPGAAAASTLVPAPAPALVEDDPKLAKYRKMQKAGLPEGAVMQAAARDGVQLPSTFFSAPAPAPAPVPIAAVAPAPAAAAVPAPPVVAEDPKFAKFRKMQKAGLPEGAVVQSAARDGVQLPADFFSAPTPVPAPVPGAAAAPAPAAAAPAVVEEDPKFAKFRKMQKAGLPEGAVVQAAARDGVQLPADFFSSKGGAGSVSGGGGPPLPPPLPAAQSPAPATATPVTATPAPAAEAPKSKYELCKRGEVRRGHKGENLRGIFWNVLPAKRVETSFWPQLSDAPPFGIDAHLLALEELFAKSAGGATIKPPSTPTSGKEQGGRAERASLLDGKRQQNLGIALARFKEPIPELKRLVLAMDADFLTMESVHKLLSICPSPEEAAAVHAAEAEWSGPGSFSAGLGKEELFVFEMSKVPRLRQRLQAAFVEMSFERQSEILHESIAKYEAGVRQLLTSREWRTLLHLCLVAGNFLNAGNKASCGAWGIEVSTGLQKLAEAKATGNPRYSLLHWVAEVADAKAPELFALADRLDKLDEAAALKAEDLKADLAQLTKGCELVERELKACSGAIFGEPSDAPGARAFVSALKPFLLETGKPVVQRLTASMAQLEEHAAKLLETHGEVPSKCSASQLMLTAITFCRALAKAREENLLNKVVDAKKKALEEGKAPTMPAALQAAQHQLSKQIKADQLNHKLKSSFELRASRTKDDKAPPCHVQQPHQPKAGTASTPKAARAAASTPKVATAQRPTNKTQSA